MAKPVIYAAVAIGLLVVGGLGYQAMRQVYSPKEQPKPKAQSPGPGSAGAGSGAAAAPAAVPGGAAPSGPRAPTNVEVARVIAVDLTDEIAATGTLRARESVMLRPEISGRITALGFSDGDRVQQGQMMVQLDASLPAAEVEQVKAELALAKSNYQRNADLAAKNFVSPRALEESAANLKVVEARLQLAQARLARSQIKAPFAGVVGLRNVSVGDFVREGTDIVLLEDQSSMRVDLRLPERLMGRVKLGQKIQVRFDALPHESFDAIIEAIDASVDANGRSVIARSRVPNPNGILRSGMFARAAVLLSSRPDSLMIPEEAVVPLGNDNFVFRVDAGKAVRTKVKLGLRRDGKVEILEGLKAGDEVVTAGQIKLRGDVSDIRVVDPNAPRAGTGKS